MAKKKQRTRPLESDSADASAGDALGGEVLKLLDARCRLPRSVYKLASGSVAMDTITQPTVDEGAMSAAAVISTPSPDRDGDIMLPRGVRLENYRKNPVVLWEHGLGGIATPIAKSEDPAGRLALEVGDDCIEATAYFTSSVRESEQIFALIAERIVRAASIRADVIKSRIDVQSGEKFFVAEAWELIEWSWGGLGVNPDAVAKLISRNRLAGGPICQAVLKSLRPYAPVAAAWSRGWEAGREDVTSDDEASDHDIVAKSDGNVDTGDKSCNEPAREAPIVGVVHAADSGGAALQIEQRLVSIEKTLGALERRLEEITPHERRRRPPHPNPLPHETWGRGDLVAANSLARSAGR